MFSNRCLDVECLLKTVRYELFDRGTYYLYVTSLSNYVSKHNALFLRTIRDIWVSNYV